MFISEQFAYIELHKTGGTQLRKILPMVLEGELTPGHQQARPELFTGRRIFLGSVRNPWDWYVSLWAFGCSRQGQLYHRLCQFDPDHWQYLYQDENDPDLFREWLGKILDYRYGHQVVEGYGKCPLSLFAGLLTYRYLKLFCERAGETGDIDRLLSYSQLRAYDSAKNFIKHFIRNESLEEDLFQILARYGVAVTKAKKAEVFSMERSNQSTRKLPIVDYHDAASEDLVAEKERFIIAKYGYEGPGSPPRGSC